MIHWLYDDAILLKDNGWRRGCLCLLLCLIDALAKQNRPDDKNQRTRYTTYLKDKLKDIGIDTSYHVEETDEVVHLSDIIYEYFEYYFTHEGDDRELEAYEIQIEYDRPKGFMFGCGILMDSVNEQIVFKSDWLIDILLEIAKTEIGSQHG